MSVLSLYICVCVCMCVSGASVSLMNRVNLSFFFFPPPPPWFLRSCEKRWSAQWKEKDGATGAISPFHKRLIQPPSSTPRHAHTSPSQNSSSSHHHILLHLPTSLCPQTPRPPFLFFLAPPLQSSWTTMFSVNSPPPIQWSSSRNRAQFTLLATETQSDCDAVWRSPHLATAILSSWWLNVIRHEILMFFRPGLYVCVIWCVNDSCLPKVTLGHL